MRSVRLLLALAALLVLAVPAVASTTVATTVVDDPYEAPPSLDGSPARPDLAQARVTYDQAGSIALTLRWYEPVDPAAETLVGWEVSTMPIDIGADKPNILCSGYAGDAPLAGHVGVTSTGTSGGFGIGGYQGTLAPKSAMWSADRRELTIVLEHGALAGRSYGCATAWHCGVGGGGSYDSSGNYHSGGCSRNDTVPPFYLTGYTPPAKPAPIKPWEPAPYVPWTPPAQPSTPAPATPKKPAKTPATQAEDDTFDLSLGAAGAYLRAGIRRTLGTPKRLKTRCTRESRSAVRCTGTWQRGASNYRLTSSRVWLEGDEWYFRLAGKRTDLACKRRGGSRCTRSFRIR